MRVLAKANARFSHSLIKAHGRTATAVTPEYYLGDCWRESRLVLPKKVNSRLYVEGCLLEYDLRFIIIKTRVHTEHHKAPVAHFTARGQVQEIARAMHHDDPNMGCSRGRSPERRRRRPKLMVGRENLRDRSLAGAHNRTGDGED